MFPHAREDGLVVRESDGGMMIHDAKADKSHTLNRGAAMLWKMCDGKTGVDRMAEALAADGRLPKNEELVWTVLRQFSRNNLLRESVQVPQNTSRRSFVKGLGAAAALALPMVLTMGTPTVAQTASTAGPGAADFTDNPGDVTDQFEDLTSDIPDDVVGNRAQGDAFTGKTGHVDTQDIADVP